MLRSVQQWQTLCSPLCMHSLAGSTLPRWSGQELPCQLRCSEQPGVRQGAAALLQADVAAHTAGSATCTLWSQTTVPGKRYFKTLLHSCQRELTLQL